MEAERKTKREKRIYDEAFRREAVALLESSPEPLSELAARLGVSHWNLRDWRKRYGSRAEGRKGSRAASARPDLRGEVARLRKENASLQARCEVLKKALGILAEPSANATRG
jgi:transposase